jgi:hypothetical protein
MAKTSLKSLVSGGIAPLPARPEAPASQSQSKHAEPSPSYRTAQTRADTRQIGGHFKAEVAQTLKVVAAEQDKDVQELLAEALNMLFSRYGKPTRVEVTSGRRNRPERR